MVNNLGDRKSPCRVVGHLPNLLNGLSMGFTNWEDPPSRLVKNQVHIDSPKAI